MGTSACALNVWDSMGKGVIYLSLRNKPGPLPGPRVRLRAGVSPEGLTGRGPHPHVVEAAVSLLAILPVSSPQQLPQHWLHQSESSLCVLWSLEVSHSPACSRELASRGRLRGRRPPEEKLPKFEWLRTLGPGSS